MTDSEHLTAFERHYSPGDLQERVLAGLRAAGKDLDQLKPEDLAPFDQFHTGGRAATIALAELVVAPGLRVLDIGGALGGAARTLAAAYDCTVIVLDPVAEYCRVGAMLNAMTGLSGRVSCKEGSGLAVPAADGAFDLVWTQHISMNIAAKGQLYQEIQRVMRPGGRLALHEPIAGPNQPIHLPVPWAREASMNLLLPEDEMRATVTAQGLREESWEDITAWTTDWLAERVGSMRDATALPPLGLHLLLGPELPQMLVNLLANLREGRVRTVRGVFSRD